MTTRMFHGVRMRVCKVTCDVFEILTRALIYRSLMKKWMKGGEDGVWEKLDKQTIADIVLCYGLHVSVCVSVCPYGGQVGS